MDQLESNIRYAETALANSLSSDELAVYEDVKKLFMKSYKVHCTGCHYCMPCPAGVNIPGCFSAYNTYFALNKGTSKFQYIMTNLLGNKPTYASLCKHCGKCEKHCPQHLKIREELQQVSKKMEGLQFKLIKFALRFIHKKSHN